MFPTSKRIILFASLVALSASLFASNHHHNTGNLSDNPVLFTIIFGTLCSIFGIVFYNITQGFVLWLMLKRLNGKYHEYNEKNVMKTDSEFIVKYNFWKNLFWFGYSLEINQVCEKRGNWRSIIPISPSKPLIGTGHFQYTTKTPNAWGTQDFTINLQGKVIYVEATAKHKHDEVPNRYWLKKV